MSGTETSHTALLDQLAALNAVQRREGGQSSTGGGRDVRRDARLVRDDIAARVADLLDRMQT